MMIQNYARTGRKANNEAFRISSSTFPFSSFERIKIDGEYSEAYNENGLMVFIDIENKQMYIFEGENVEIKTSNPIVFIKYTARL